MFSRITVVFVTLAASVLATPYKRTSDLVKVTPAAFSLDSVGDLKFTASVTNTGSETVKILKYGAILEDNLPAKSFTVTKDDTAAPFTGIKLSVSLNEVDQSAFVIIPAGETFIATREGSMLCKTFPPRVLGKFSFVPKTVFVIASAPAALVTLAAPSFTRVEAAATSVEVDIKGDLAKREIEVLEGHAKNICSTSSKKTFIDSSYSVAKTFASTAVSYINSRGASDSLYEAYFRTTSTSKITGILNAVANENSSGRTHVLLSCVDTYNACSGGVTAYTVTSTTNIHYCSIFFNEVATSKLCSGITVASRNVRGGTTLHELTRALGGTDDIAYGCSADQDLSTANKALNAHNYNCFTTQVYANTRC